MAKITNYAIRRSRDGTSKVLLEITGERDLMLCRNTGNFYYVIPRCTVPSVLDEEKAKKFIGTVAKGQMKKLFVEQYEIVNWKTREVYSFTYSFGFKPSSMKEVIGITPISLADIQY